MENRCKYCGHLQNAPSDNRDMSLTPVTHGKEIYNFLLNEGFKSIDICNFCYAHLALFRKEHPHLKPAGNI